MILGKVEETTLNEYSPAVLAYMGDAVFELLVRSSMVTSGNRKVKNLHLDTVEKVKAESQARAVRKLYRELNPDEQEIFRRGRNTKSTPPQNADIIDYKMSTGFEALMGYLYLKGDENRLLYLVEKALRLEEAELVE